MKKSFALVAALAMLISLTNLPLAAAKERRGATVEVTMTDGSQVKGELLAIKTNALLVYDRVAGQGMSLDLLRVAQVKLLKKSKFLRGLAIGLGVGLGLCIYNNGIMGRHNGLNEYIHVFVLPVTCALGGILGSFSSLPKKFTLAGASSQSVQKNLERFKHHAREQDTP